MSETKFTPGPWVWMSDYAGPEDEYGCATCGPIDVDSWRPTGHSGNPRLYSTTSGVEIIDAGSGEYCPYEARRESGRANAHLIAAAPELFAALDAIVQELGGLPVEHVERARDALARARGES